MREEQLRPVLQEACERYVSHFRAVVRRARSERPQVVPEVLIEINSPEATLLRRLTRVDVMWGGAAKPSVLEANHDPVDTSRPVYAEPGPPVLHVFPVVWNACDLVLPAPVELGSEFEAWFESWLDVADEKPSDEDGLAGVIHSVTSPTWYEAGGWGFTVDLGSAPPDALLELLSLPCIASVSVVRVGSFTYS